MNDVFMRYWHEIATSWFDFEIRRDILKRVLADLRKGRLTAGEVRNLANLLDGYGCSFEAMVLRKNAKRYVSRDLHSLILSNSPEG